MRDQSSRRSAVGAIAAAAILCAPPALAEDVAAPPASTALAPTMDPPADPRLARAKELFHDGVALLQAGDVERALVKFLESRKLVPSGSNTANAAICLDRLGRYDEALELYELLVTRFAGDLDEEDRAVIGPAMTALREKTGSIDVSSNVQGLVVVNGRARGTLPLSTPVRVLGGTHVVRVIKDGYRSYETKVKVALRATVRVDAKLEAIPGAGVLRVEEPDGSKISVFVDGKKVGATPWEGTLGEGPHVVWTAQGDNGSAPRSVTVLEGQTTLLRAPSERLGPPVAVDARPRTAALSLDGVPLGKGTYRGRLPAGSYRFEVSEDGYHSRSLRVNVPEKTSRPLAFQTTLPIDEEHPRWPRNERRASVGFAGGYLRGATLGAGAEQTCPEGCSTDPSVSGFVAGLRGGLRVVDELSAELEAGYLSFGSSFGRTLPGQPLVAPGVTAEVSYDLRDELVVQGPYSALGASYRWALPEELSAVARLKLGAMLGRSSDDLSGTAEVDNGMVTAAAVAVEGGDGATRALVPFVSPEVGIERRFGAFSVGLSFGVMWLPFAGPSLELGEIGPTPNCSAPAASPGCVGTSDVVARDRAFDGVLLWTPALFASYSL